MEAEGHLIRFFWVCGAAVAGAISALPTMNWKQMGIGERLLTVFVGGAFAVYLTPLIVARFTDKPDLQTVCAFTYIMGICGNAVVPIVIRRGKAWAESWGKSSEEKEA